MPDSASMAKVNTAPRICYVDLTRVAPGAAFARAAERGFTHVLVPPTVVASGDPLLVASLAPLDDALPALIGAARASGLALLLDVVIDRVATGGALLAEAAGVYQAPGMEAGLDPRETVRLGAAAARMEDGTAVERLGAFWGGHLARWSQAGVAGFRLVGLAACPAGLLPGLVRALRQDAGTGLLLGWTPGMTRPAMRALKGTGLDGVFGSLPWWDMQAGWLWDELAILREVAPVIGGVAAPFGPGLNVAENGCSGRAALVAALMGDGWMSVDDEAGAVVAKAVNDALAGEAGLAGARGFSLPAGSGGAALAILRTDTPDARAVGRAALLLVNTDAMRPQTVDAGLIMPALGGRFAALRRVALGPGVAAMAGGSGSDAAVFGAGSAVMLAPGEALLFVGEADGRAASSRVAPDIAGARAGAVAGRRLGVEMLSPAVDGGAFPVKRTAGEIVTVAADVVFDGHDKIAVALRWQAPGQTAWQETAMRPLGNDRWEASFPLATIGLHHYQVTAWRDRFATFRDELAKKYAAGVSITLELQEGAALVRQAAARAASVAEVSRALTGVSAETQRDVLLSDATAAAMAAADDRPFATESAAIPVDAERLGARFASWYEVFPRSLSDDEHRHGTFADVVRHLPRVRDMGFDVLYFPPIHPIGRTNRKGRNNTLTPAADDPGSPYAIGSAEGGHDALHPELGSLADFRALLRAASEHGLELAIDFAIQCAPDHPWLRAHRGWFDWRPDGSIRYAENPPKKYEDIVNVDFYTDDAVPALWLELCRVVLFWAEQGVRLFRVDNPHTKPLPFWQWMIAEVRRQYPDAVFLAEAFTRPKIMYRLAKIGFSQSYTYFTWRNTKRELVEYLEELADEAPREFFRPHFFVNTPDINPVFLQTSGRPGFLIRAALAATLSGLWGVYNGFELCEAAAVPGKEEYLDSEKYQLRAWDWDRPGNIVAEVTALNHIRRANPALQTHLGVSFLPAGNETVIVFEKAVADRSNVVLIAVSMDPAQPQETDFEVPLWKWQLSDDASLVVEDLVGGASFALRGKYQHIRLTPEEPYAIWRVRPAA